MKSALLALGVIFVLSGCATTLNLGHEACLRNGYFWNFKKNVCEKDADVNAIQIIEMIPSSK